MQTSFALFEPCDALKIVLLHQLAAGGDDDDSTAVGAVRLSLFESLD